MAILVELYAGFAALSLFVAGGLEPPVSRIGSKRGYARAIAARMGFDTGGRRRDTDAPVRVILCDRDPMIVNFWRTVASASSGVSPYLREELSWQLRTARLRSPRRIWESAKGMVEVARAGRFDWSHPDVLIARDFLIYTAGARGGVGGFKGHHIRRPSVEGFIPRLETIAARIERMAGFARSLEVIHGLAEDVAPIPGAFVYLDPPYPGTAGYGTGPTDVAAVAEKWHRAGAHVFVSQGAPLGALERYPVTDITRLREGQARRSLTRSTQELLYEIREAG